MVKINLENKIALVTGAGAGIGRGCALALANCGANIAVNDINVSAGKSVVQEIEALGRQAIFLETDVSDARAVTDMLETTHERFGALDILVNNAGLSLFQGITETSPEQWDQVMNVDLRGLYLVTRAALPLLERSSGASIVNIASVHAQLTIGNIAAYAAAKGGVVSLARSLAQELGVKGIRVNTLSPGFVESLIMDRWLDSTPDPEATLARVNALHPLGRIGTPEDIGNLVSFLSSDLAGFITGANIAIDGGLSTRLMH